MLLMRRARSVWTPTPMLDELERLTDGEPLATWNRHRGPVRMDGRRAPGGEWDEIRAWPLRVRRQLTSAGFMSKHGVSPDEMCDIMARHGCHVDQLTTWYQAARGALRERQRAANRDRHESLARANGHATYYEHRSQWCRDQGYASLWAYRVAKGWASNGEEGEQAPVQPV